jgi:hypothetical protein
MAIDKHQCIARLDKIELDKLDIIAESAGLSRSGAIRRLIREFNLEPSSDKSASKFIVDGQISKDIFLQLPVRHPLWFSAVRNPKTHKLEIRIYDGVDIVDDVIICGYINYPELVKSSVRDNYMHDILYLCNDRLYKDTQFTHAGEDIDILREYSRVEECLNQIFVV